MARRRLRRLVTRGELGSACIALELFLLTLLFVSTQAVIHLPEHGSRDEPGFSIEIARGRIDVEIVTLVIPMLLDQPEERAWVKPLNDAGLNLGFTFSRDQSTLVPGLTIREWISIGIPLWFVMLVVAAPAILMWRTGRAKAGHCPRCRYDLRGIKGSVCPECGKPTERDS